jgi:hypothetical protein
MVGRRSRPPDPAQVLGAPVPALIYAGHAAASSSRAAPPSRATLRSGVHSNHLRGKLGSSICRRTLSALMRAPLELEIADMGALRASPMPACRPGSPRI